MLVYVGAEEGLSVGDFEVARMVAEWIELLAIAVIAAGVVMAVIGGLSARVRSDAERASQIFKRYMSRGLLMGLDLLIAADVIKTVTLEPTIENAAVLALLVIVRTFLSWTLILEFEGRWPWQRNSESDGLNRG